MAYEFYEFVTISTATLLALVLVRFRDRQKRKFREVQSMKRMLATVCK